jgi:hypothetical protein
MVAPHRQSKSVIASVQQILSLRPATARGFRGVQAPSPAAPGTDWGSVANRIGRMIPWEFAYRYDDHIDRHYGQLFPPAQKMPPLPGDRGQ